MRRPALILAIDSSSLACTAALFDADGTLLGARDELIGRGHAERLVPMIAEVLDGRVPSAVLVGVGPGSFTGLRVALAAAHGLAIGWNVPLTGMPSLALIAAGAPGTASLTVAVAGGHGELFVQSFARAPFRALGAARSLTPAAAAAEIGDALVVGNGAAALVAARGFGEAIDLVPSARFALSLPEELRGLRPAPLYVRAPDARPKAA